MDFPLVGSTNVTMCSKPLVGIWLDHREALLFWTDQEAEMQLQRIVSQYQETAEPVDRARPGGSGGPTPVLPHANVARRRKEQLNHYYRQLADRLHTAEQIYLFGPGQAKRELAQTLQGHKDISGRLRAVESADRMTQPQMAARVRSFFRIPRES